MNRLHASFMSAAFVLAVALPVAAQFVDEAWRVKTVKGVSVVTPEKTRLVIAADGSFTTSVGCNSMRGRAEVSGDLLKVGPVAATRMACPEPLMNLETAYEKALLASRSFRRSGDELIMMAEDGSETIVFRRQ